MKVFAPVAFTLFAGAALTIGATIFVWHWEKDRAFKNVETAANQRFIILEQSIKLETAVIQSLKGLFSASRDVTRQQFGDFVSSIMRDLGTVQAVEWIPRVDATERAYYESKAKNEGYSDFMFTERESQGRMVAARARDRYYPVFYVEPLEGNEIAFGFDLGSEPTRLEALRQARDSGDMVASGRIILVQETDTEFGFLVFQPIYLHGQPVTTISQRRENLLGFILGVYQVSNIVGKGIGAEDSDQYEIDLYIRDQSAPAGKETLYPSTYEGNQRVPKGSMFCLERSLGFAHRSWLVTLCPAREYLTYVSFWLSWATVVVGVVVTLILAKYLQSLLRHDAEIERAAQDLRNSEQSLEKAQRIAKMGSWEWNAREDKYDWSHEMYRVLGFRSPVPVASAGAILEKVHPDDRAMVRNIIPDVDDHGANHGVDFRVCDPRGSIRFLNLQSEVRVDGSGAPIGRVGTLHDVTTTKEFENALQRAKEDAEQAAIAKSRFLAATSHDLRQAPQALSFLFGTLLQTKNSKKKEQIIDDALFIVNDIDNSLNSLFEISKLDVGKIKPDVKNLSVKKLFYDLDREVRPYIEKKSLILKTVLSNIIIASDLSLVKCILKNFVLNAIQYTPRGKILLGCRRGAATVRLEVWDSGIGIPNDKLDKIFDEFYRVHKKNRYEDGGIGLGLAIVKRAADLLEHRIDVVSTEGKGSMFAVEVPIGTGDVSDYETKEVMNILQGMVATSSIVVVDDDLNVLANMERLLESWGANVIATRTCAEAVEIIVNDKCVPDLVIADYCLEDEDTGVDVIQQLCALTKRRVPGIIITGDVSAEVRDQASGAGFHIIHKPVPPSKLRSLINHVLRSNAQFVD